MNALELIRSKIYLKCFIMILLITSSTFMSVVIILFTDDKKFINADYYYELVKILALVFTFIVIIGAIAAFHITKRVVSTIINLEKVLGDTSAQASYHEAASGKYGDFDIIKEHFEEIKDYVNIREKELVGLHENIKLQGAMEKRPSLVKGQFIRFIADDFGRRLNSIVSVSSNIIKHNKEVLPQEQVSKLVFIKNEAKELLNSISFTSNLVEADESKKPVKMDLFNIIEIIEEQKKDLAKTIEEKQLEYLIDLYSEESIPVYSDRKIISGVLYSLLTNIIAFTIKGSVKIAIDEYEKNYYKIVIQGEVTSITAEEIKFVFDEFTESSEYCYLKKSPTKGLDLFFTKHQVELLGGKIDAKITGTSGMSFILIIPIGR